MKKDVIIHINGMQYADATGSEEPIEVIAPGQYYFKNGNHYLVFDEINDSTERSRNLMKFRDSYLEVVRKGTVNTQMVFEENKKTKSFYGTPFGQLNIGVATTMVSCIEDDNKIEVKANYSLEINDSFVADCAIHLTAFPKSDGCDLTS